MQLLQAWPEFLPFDKTKPSPGRRTPMHSFRIARAAALIGLAGALSLSACGNSSSSTAGGNSASGKKTAASGLVIGYSMPDVTEPFWASMTYGVKQEAKKLGIKIVLENAGGDANVSQQISQLQDLLQRHVSALLVGATDAQGIAGVVNQVAASGIPVIGVSSIPNSNNLTALVVTDNAAMGKGEADCLGQALNGKGQVGALAGPAGQSWADMRLAGFRKEIAAKYPNIKVVAISRLADSTNAGFTTMQDWVQRFPGLTGLYSATDDIGAGALQALKAANDSQVHVATSNFSPGDAAFLKSGAFVCTAAQEVVLQGTTAVQTAVAAIQHKLASKMIVKATPVTMITKSNIGSVNYSTISAPVGYKP